MTRENGVFLFSVDMEVSILKAGVWFAKTIVWLL